MRIELFSFASLILIFSIPFNILLADVADNSYIVIGGGISGLAACVELIKNGVPKENIQLLEASDRLGGRIQSQQISRIGYLI
jgi:heterodisulfide reductase subunit A-like polyferredoxin